MCLTVLDDLLSTSRGCGRGRFVEGRDEADGVEVSGMWMISY